MSKAVQTSVKEKISIVWLKRDIRSQDHKPLDEAEKAGLPYLIIYIFEPSLIQYPDTSLRHLQFIYHSLLDLNSKLKSFNREVNIFHKEAIQVFDFLTEQYEVESIFSYQESGTKLSWDRDKRIAKLLSTKRIFWKEYKKNAVVRGINNRSGWDDQWHETMLQPQVKNKFSTQKLELKENPFQLSKALSKEVSDYPKDFQPAGETYAWKYLASFTHERGKNYHRHISKPDLSRLSCGRISPYLAWGNISIKQAAHHIKFHQNYENNKLAYNGILTRLKWHCHFIQKFEVECEYETHCINRGYESLNRELNQEFVTAWESGQTGYPLIDACMRCLQQTGWINFRMRAMVVSLLCHHLDQDWRVGVYHLARLFLDYEPGIHFPQFQMQAGTTGVNTVRIYNPVKNSQEHDPEGVFIKKWIPELKNIPIDFLHEPWKMTSLDQAFNNFELGKDYPAPIVDLMQSGKIARDKIWGHRKNEKVKAERKRIIQTHTRNN